MIYKLSTDTVPFMTVYYAYDEAYLLKKLDYQWGDNYYATLNYNYSIYNGVERITSNTVDYNVHAPNPAYYMAQYINRDMMNSVQSNFYTNKSYTNTYTYDPLGRLTDATESGINPVPVGGQFPDFWFRKNMTSFSNLDLNGNPLNKQVIAGRVFTNGYEFDPSPVNESFGYNYLNQMTTREQGSIHTDLTYDDNGNLTSETSSGGYPSKNYQYNYGLDNQLTRMVYNDLQHVKLNTYELGGRLLRWETDTLTNANSPVTFYDYFYYSHDGLAAKYESGTDRGYTVSRYFTRLGRELLSSKVHYSANFNDEDDFYIQNNRGDVIMLINSNGNADVITDYDAAGQTLQQAPFAWDPFGFTGGGVSFGGGLIQLGARYYDSTKSSFIQQDRYMGDPSDPLSLNRYVYCGMDPVNYIDPTGFSQTSDMAIGLSWLPFIDSPVLPFGDIAYGLIVGGTALYEYGPQLMFMADQIGQGKFSGNSGGTSDPGGLDPGNWGKGSLKSATDSLQYHFEKHGAEVGAKDIQQYLRKAEAFSQNLKGATSYEIDGFTDGVMRYIKNGRYIDLAPDGTIISFGAR